MNELPPDVIRMLPLRDYFRVHRYRAEASELTKHDRAGRRVVDSKGFAECQACWLKLVETEALKYH